jgi:LacI family transcriptional regulator
MANIQEVARVAGVSTASVSRFLAGQPIRRANEVREAIDALGYQPSRVARSLKSGRHDSVGVIVPDITNPYFAALVKGIERELRSHGLQVILGNSDEDAERERSLVDDLAQRTDGIIMAPFAEYDEAPSTLARAGVPLVLVDRETTADQQLDRVLVDNASGVEQAVDHLVALGHTHIGAISGPLVSSPGRSRHEAFLASLERHGLPLDESVLRVSDFRDSGGHRAMSEIWRAARRPTAVFVANNLMTMGALTALRELGVRLPDELSLVGFDDVPLGALLDPPLTAVSRPDVEQGATAGRLLLERLGPEAADRPARRITMPVEMVVRGSTGPVPHPAKGLHP